MYMGGGRGGQGEGGLECGRGQCVQYTWLWSPKLLDPAILVFGLVFAFNM